MVIFDGTTKIGEVFAIVFRWVTCDLIIVQRLVDIGKYTYSFRAEELVAAVVTILRRYNISTGTRPPNKVNGQVIAFQRDRVAVNTCAVAILLRNYVNSKDMECLSHTLVHPGEKFVLHFLNKFKQDLCALEKSSYLFSQHWFSIIGQKFRQPGNTRWWATYELYNIICINWNDIYTCITTAVVDGDVGEDGARVNRLNETITNDIFRAQLRLELAFVVIVAKPLVQATYLLEGDGPCSLIAYDLLMKCKVWFELHYQELTFPNLLSEIDVAVEVLSPIMFNNDDVQCRQAMKEHVTGAIRPVYNYFINKIFGELAEDVIVYKILRFTNPFSIKRMNYEINFHEVRNDLLSLGNFNDQEITAILNEFPTYLLLCEEFNDIPYNLDEELKLILRFWLLHKNQLPGFSIFVRYAYTIAPSSASVERVFSILKASFGSQQNLAIEDYIQASLMYQYNNR